MCISNPIMVARRGGKWLMLLQIIQKFMIGFPYPFQFQDKHEQDYLPMLQWSCYWYWTSISRMLKLPTWYPSRFCFKLCERSQSLDLERSILVWHELCHNMDGYSNIWRREPMMNQQLMLMWLWYYAIARLDLLDQERGIKILKY